MQSQFIFSEIKNNISIITLNRPEALNALNLQVLHELNYVLKELNTSEVRCLIIRGAGDKAFVAGADIAEMKDFTKEEAYSFSKLGNDVFTKISQLPFPTIAVIKGYALGGGCELALSCDIRLCTEKSYFGQPETSIGIIPGFGGTQRLARIVGIAKAKQLIFTSKMINSKEAYQIGLVNEIYRDDELFEKSLEMAQNIANNAPIAIRAAKKAINICLQSNLESALELEEDLFSSTFQTNDQKEGMNAFLEKRTHLPYTNS